MVGTIYLLNQSETFSLTHAEHSILLAFWQCTEGMPSIATAKAFSIGRHRLLSDSFINLLGACYSYLSLNKISKEIAFLPRYFGSI